VWIEPVRDWNRFAGTIAYGTILMCELNLWGIETEDFGWIVKIANLCELNLWGIETNFPPILFAKFKMCELNLWGIETRFNKEKFKEYYWCELNLWGIETINNRVEALQSPFCVNWTCEGLKLFSAGMNNGIKLRCELNLWGIETVQMLLWLDF